MSCPQRQGAPPTCTAALLAAALLGCTRAPASPPDAGDVPGHASAARASRAPPLAVDWSALPQRPLTADGWQLERCGELHLCARHPQLGTGSVEVLRFPAASHPDFQRVRTERGVDAALRWLAEDHTEGVRRDREASCGGARVVVETPRPLRVDGHPAVVAGFAVQREGRVVEESRTTFVFTGADLQLLAASGVDPERGCLERVGEFTAEGFRAFVPVYLRILEGSRLGAVPR